MPKRKFFDKKFFFLVFQLFFSFLFLLNAIIFFAYHSAYRNKIIPHTFVGPFNLSNKTPQEAYDYLQPKFKVLNKQVVAIKVNNQIFQANLEELGIDYDAKTTVIKAYQSARSNNLFQDVKTEIDAWFNSQLLTPEIDFNEEIFNLASQNLFKKFEKPGKNALFIVKGKSLAINPSEEGFYIDRQKLKKEISVRAKKIAFSEIILQPIPDHPKIIENDLTPIKESVEEFVFNPPYFTFEKNVYQLSSEKTSSFLRYLKNKNGSLIVTSNNQEIVNYINQLSKTINRHPKGQIFEVQGNRVIKFAPSEDGYEVDQEKAIEIYASAIHLYFEATDAPKLALELPLKITPAPKSPNEYGIKKLLGEGVSNYKGSSAGRSHNIALGSSRLNGILIPPGKTFYFNRNIGEVSDRTGYKTAWIIKGNRTVLGVGGGVCQISTTVFRAALNSGLPIIERAAHAYRVSYYEYESGMGFDATVYDPRPDLIFENDTPAYILITSEVDKKNTRLYFRIYGTSDGRQVELTGPKIAYQSRPPAPLYQEDSSLPKGVVKQVDFAAWGADVSIYRKVYRNGEVLQDDEFRSIYKPWRAVFLVGTG